MNNCIGRTEELERLQSYKESREAELIAVYGRRRVGKTFLIRTAYNNQFAFYHTGLSPLEIKDENMLKAQLEHFNRSLKQYWDGYEQSAPADWFEAFMRLHTYLSGLPKNKKQIVFIDEMPWMATPRSNFLTAFEAFWNGRASSQNNLLFIVCGSATGWMVDNLVNNYGGLYGRITHSIALQPFTLQECEKFENHRQSLRSRDEILRAYMIFGGIPYYWKQLEPGQSLVQNIDRLFFRPDGVLRKEFETLYASIFRQHRFYMSIIEILSKKRGGMTRSSVIEKLGLQSGSNITKALEDLENSGFIYSYRPLGERDTTYMLCDFYTWFYFKFINGKKGGDPGFWSTSQNTPAVNTWQGLTFELVCLWHSQQIKRALQIAGIHCSPKIYRSQNAQIDLLLDRADKTVTVCEMKYTDQPYNITATEDMRLRNRISDIRPYFKKSFSFNVIIVTPCGVKRGRHTGFISGHVTLDDLFA